jgi:[FeFe] hydrogenase H-cluster maturation GTPase HydF
MKTLKSQRLHIAIFGKTNAGKSTLLNRIVGQEVSIVSEIPGTTTDVVEKSMELLPIGPVTFLDTAGLDDVSELGEKRIEKTLKILDRTDVAIVIGECDITNELEARKIPYLTVKNTIEITELKEKLVKLLPDDFINSPKIVGDLVPKGATVILVVPIDKEAPKGRIILPQVQVIRDLLDSDCLAYVVKETELAAALNNLKEPPALVVTDSQAFKLVSQIVPENIPLTSFSILFARLKGDLQEFIRGAAAIDALQEGDRVLILESCTHHAIEDDIGRVKLPRWLREKTGKSLEIDNYSGHDFPDIMPYKLIIHCGACMTNRREVLSRILTARKAGIPITNYGVAISYCLGILQRATSFI